MNKRKTLASHVKILVLILLFVCQCITMAHSQSNTTTAASQKNISKVERGITGTRQFPYSGKPLRAKPQRDTDASIVLRLTALPTDSKTYEAKFLGNKVGTFNLHANIEHEDGSEATDLPPLAIEIVSTLPKDQRSDLFEAATFEPKVWGGYRLSIVLIGLIWLSIPVIVLIRRAMKPKAVIAPPIVEVVPTFADKLKPLVEAAAAGSLSVREKGQLELLLVHYWRERISLQGVDMASTISQLRVHPEAGQLVRTVERWLHQSDDSADSDECSPQSIMSLLEPYRADVARVSAS